MVFGAFRSFPRLGLVWVWRLTQTLTQTALKPKWRGNAVFEAFSETKHPDFTRNPGVSGATGQTRTGDLLITNQLLYRLSHSSISAWLFYHMFLISSIIIFGFVDASFSPLSFSFHFRLAAVSFSACLPLITESRRKKCWNVAEKVFEFLLQDALGFCYNVG